jgi:AcrR family transcriptional regulator
MVKITYTGDGSDKSAEILNVAQKLFGLLGFGKTSMREIAGELGISKAALYYYYPDKESLYLAVIEKEVQEFIGALHRMIMMSDEPEEMLMAYAIFRIRNFQILMNLGRLRIEDIKGFSKFTDEVWQQIRRKELQEIRIILKKGKEKGIFRYDNEEDVARIFLDSLKGLGFAYLKNRVVVQLSHDDLLALEKQYRLFVQIFIKGLSN